jgi:hypothetical protein
MKKTIRIKLNSMKRSKQFVLIHPITPTNLLVTTTATALGDSITRLETLSATRNEGTGTFRGAAEERRTAKHNLKSALSSLSLVAKTLDKTTHPDVEAQLKVGRHARSYQSLLDFARAVKAVAEPIEEVFIAHGAATTFVEDLQTLITAVDAANNRKTTGLDSQVGKTAALMAEARIGMSHVRKLDSILSQLYKNNVELYAAWKAAKRQQQAMEGDEAPATPPSVSGSGSTAPITA